MLETFGPIDITKANFSARGSVWLDTYLEHLLLKWAREDAKHRNSLRDQARDVEDVPAVRQDSVQPVAGDGIMVENKQTRTVSQACDCQRGAI